MPNYKYKCKKCGNEVYEKSAKCDVGAVLFKICDCCNTSTYAHNLELDIIPLTEQDRLEQFDRRYKYLCSEFGILYQKKHTLIPGWIDHTYESKILYRDR